MSDSKFLGSISNSNSGSGEDYDSNENLNSKIVKFFIGWYDLESSRKSGFLSGIGHVLSYAVLPSFFGGGLYFQHGFCWFELENGYSCVVEYDTEGYHIVKTSFEEFEIKCQPKFYYGRFEEVINPVQLIFEGEYTIKNILEKCEKYIGKNYHLLKHNCQFFVDVFIKDLKAKRPNGKYARGNHSASVFGMPYMILDQLEKNEKDSSNIIGYIPFLGTLIDSFR